MSEVSELKQWLAENYRYGFQNDARQVRIQIAVARLEELTGRSREEILAEVKEHQR